MRDHLIPNGTEGWVDVLEVANAFNVATQPRGTHAHKVEYEKLLMETRLSYNLSACRSCSDFCVGDSLARWPPLGLLVPLC